MFAYRVFGVSGAGLAGWLVDVAVLWFSYQILGLNPSTAATVGFLTAGVVNFTLNRRVFSARHGHAPIQASRYGLLFAMNLLVIVLALPAFADLADLLFTRYSLSLVAAKIAVTGLLLPVNTWVYSVWVFKE